MGARNRADLRTVWWAWGRANKQNAIGADQLACIRAIAQKRAKGAVMTGGCDMCGNKKKTGAKSQGAHVQ